MANENKIDTVKIELTKPVTFEEVTYTELEFDFLKLTGMDVINIEDEFHAQGRFVLSTSARYRMTVAAKACTSNVGADFFETLAIKDFNNVMAAVRNFLIE